MNASLDNFILINGKEKAVILGDMKELGNVSDSEHQKVADKLSQSSISEILLIGPNFAKTNCQRAKKFNDVTALNDYLSKNPINGKRVLVKGSNSMKLIECVGLL